ncbi:hypothetical protein DFH11DRAFT_1464244, partial [Phellopilus nigrolimitatus]
MGTHDRPTEVPAWTRAKRNTNSTPKLDLDTFPPKWRSWWSSLQPFWRPQEGMDWPLGFAEPANEEWLHVRKAGKNGIFLIVLTLYWW